MTRDSDKDCTQIIAGFVWLVFDWNCVVCVCTCLTGDNELSFDHLWSDTVINGASIDAGVRQHHLSYAQRSVNLSDSVERHLSDGLRVSRPDIRRHWEALSGAGQLHVLTLGHCHHRFAVGYTRRLVTERLCERAQQLIRTAVKPLLH